MAYVERQQPLRVVVALGVSPGRVEQVDLELAAGSCIADAVRASGLAAAHPDLEFETLRTAVWGVARSPDHVLRDRDRVELLRPLKVDPKEARRRRYQAQRAAR